MTLIQKGFLGAKPDFIKNSLLTSIESRLGKHLNSSVNPLVSVQRASFVRQLFQNAHAFFALNLRGIHSHFPEIFRFFSTTTCVPVLDISTIYIHHTLVVESCQSRRLYQQNDSKASLCGCVAQTTTTTTAIWTGEGSRALGLRHPINSYRVWSRYRTARISPNGRRYLERACKDVFDREKGQSQDSG